MEAPAKDAIVLAWIRRRELVRADSRTRPAVQDVAGPIRGPARWRTLRCAILSLQSLVRCDHPLMPLSRLNRLPKRLLHSHLQLSASLGHGYLRLAT